jgi:TonB family protein
METRSRPGILVSVLAHAGVLGCLLWAGVTGHLRPKNQIVAETKTYSISMMQTAGASHALPVPVHETPSTGQSRKSPELTVQRKMADPNRALHAARVAPPKDAQAEGRGTGSAVAGTGADAQDATPAFPVFSPKPPVIDRGLLPAAEQQIVVDVNVNAQGDVVSETLVKGMGTALDQIVLETVKNWRFHPATVNGTAVASESELIFPFNLSYPITRG